MSSLAVGVAGAYVVQIAGNAFLGISNNTSTNAQTYVMPDGITFAVWGVIYLLLALLVVRQIMTSRKGTDPPCLNNTTRGLLCLSFFLNPFYLYLNNEQAYWPSSIELILYAVTLAVLYLKMDIRYGSPASAAPWSVQFYLFSGISANFAWSVVAAAVNFTNSALYSELGIETGPTYAVCVIVAVSLLAALIAVVRLDISYAAVSMWALSGIARMQSSIHPQFHRPLSHEVVVAAHAGMASIAIAMAVGVAYHYMKKPGQLVQCHVDHLGIYSSLHEDQTAPVSVAWVEGAPPPPCSTQSKFTI